MDFHTLARRDLQALCKENKIPANITNAAMADALSSLQHVEGLEELLNPPEHDVTQSPERLKCLSKTPVVTRSMTRASTRRTTVLESESGQLPPCTTTRRSMRNRNAAGTDKESKVLNLSETPAVSGAKKRAEAVSVRPKVEKDEKENEKDEEGDVVIDEIVNTVGKSRRRKTQASVAQRTQVFTRRSTRLLEKSVNDKELGNKVARDLEPITMGDLATDGDLTEEPKAAMQDEYPSVTAQTVVEVGSDENRDEIGAVTQTFMDENPKEISDKSVGMKSSGGNETHAETEGDITEKCEKSDSNFREVEALAEVGNEIEADWESNSSEICDKSEIEDEPEVDAPVEAESDISQVCEKSESNFSEVCEKSESNFREVEALAEAGNEIEADRESNSSEICDRESNSGEICDKSEIKAEPEVDAPVEAESESDIHDSQVIDDVQNKKSDDELDDSSNRVPQEGFTSNKETADENGFAKLEEHVAVRKLGRSSDYEADVLEDNVLTDVDNVQELTLQVNLLNLDSGKDTDEDIDSGKTISADPEVNNTLFLEEKAGLSGEANVVLDRYLNLGETYSVLGSTAKVELLNDGGEKDGIYDKPAIHSAALSVQPNNPLPNSAEKMELNVTVQLADVDVTEAERFVELHEWPKKSNGTSAHEDLLNEIADSEALVDVQVIPEVEFVEGANETNPPFSKMNSPVCQSADSKLHNSEIQIQGGGIDTEPWEDFFSNKTPVSSDKTNKIPPSPLKSSRKKMQSTVKKMSNSLEDGNKENVGENVDLLFNDEEKKMPTPLTQKSLGQLRKMLKEKTQTKIEKKRLALQMLPDNHMAVGGEKDD